MASYWSSNSQKVYLPPTTLTKAVSTDTYVTRLGIYYHGHSDRLLTVGHPFYEITNGRDQTMRVPKVSAIQFPVFRVILPNPNKSALPDSNVFDPDSERLVWAVKTMEICRGQPIGPQVTGHPLFNRFEDVENPAVYKPGFGTGDKRQIMASDYKQIQMVVLGCRPALGEHWGKTRSICPGIQNNVLTGDCPAIELFHTTIEDGDMVDIGLGNLDFAQLQADKSGAPLDIVQSICKYPDTLKMAQEITGDTMFFSARREQSYLRHMMTRAGINKEAIPQALYIKGATEPQNTVGTSVYCGVVSGSLFSSDAQIFNRPFWLNQAQGLNNGIAWNNQLFVTAVDNTRATNFTITVATDEREKDTYDAGSFNAYLRHVESYELQFVFELCKVKLTPENLTILHQQDPGILKGWELGVTPPSGSVLEDTYRYINSVATKCPPNPPEEVQEDPWGRFAFWRVDLSERFSLDLDQFPLGRRFLALSAPRTRTSAAKRKTPVSAKSSKQRRKG
uniref:Major capsid protein L1 n=1 Tax=Equus caballus papillomavirus 1 TaxID=333920 RepID=A0A5J6SGU8_ECPV1|nr:major capsid protein [Equus caballus papillomavirus 1]